MNQAILDQIIQDPESPFIRFTVDQVTRMIEAGIFADKDRFELLDGFLILKDSADADRGFPTRIVRYHSVVDGLCHRLTLLLTESNAVVRCKSPVRLRPNFTASPELAVVRGTHRNFLTDYPGDDSIELIVEVELSWLARGRRIEKDQYARAGVPNYWLIDLRQSHIEVYQSPDRERGTYTECLILKGHETIRLPLPGFAVDGFSVEEILNATI